MMRFTKRSLIITGFVLLGLLLAGGTLTGFYAEYHWFRSVGHLRRFWTLELAGWGAGIGLFLLTAAIVGVSISRTARTGGPVQVRRKLGDLEIAEALPGGWVRLGVIAAAVLAGLLVAAPFAQPLARSVLFNLNAAPWGEVDPILGRDHSFYVFLLPLLRISWSILVAILTWVIVGIGAFLLLAGRIRATADGIEVDAFARRRLAYLGAGVLLLMGAHFGLSIYEVVSGGPIGYAQVQGEIPARRLMGILAGLTAVFTIYGGRTENWRPALISLAVVVVAWPVGVSILPEVLQRFRVEPNEFQVERPYLAAEIEATRRAYALDEISRVSYPVTREVPDRTMIDRSTAGLPLWDERPLEASYNQLQGLIAYHLFPDVDSDRYGSADDPEQVAVAVREFAPSRLSPAARTWQNLHLRYTHGSGTVVTAVDQATEGGEPKYFVQDLPPQTADDAPSGLEIEEPRVFFGELTTEYIVLDPDSVPAAGRPTGVELSGLIRRSLFAWALNSKNILLRDPGEGRGLLVWRRDVLSRVRELVPFLLVDPDPYPVIHEGSVSWIVELYAASNRYPLSRPGELLGRRANYLRGAGKAVVDGVTGEVQLFVTDPDEPLTATYRRTFPDLFRPLEEMSPALRRHIRYPQPLFNAQAILLQEYHMTEPSVFYQKQDLWSLGREVYENRALPVEPYFLVMPFPGEDRAEREFLLTLPFTPRNRDNLSAFLIARNDDEHYGELALFDLGGQQQVFGPRQVEVQIDQDAVISQQLSLWRQQGSRATRGHLLLVPIEGFLLYVEPLFLEAEDREGAAPGLKRVIAAAGDRVAMGTTLEEVLDRLLGDAPRVAPLEAEVGEAPTDTAAAGGAEAQGQLGQIRRLLEEADRALEAGDLTRFGQLWEEIRERAATGPEEGSGGE